MLKKEPFFLAVNLARFHFISREIFQSFHTVFPAHITREHAAEECSPRPQPRGCEWHHDDRLPSPRHRQGRASSAGRLLKLCSPPGSDHFWLYDSGADPPLPMSPTRARAPSTCAHLANPSPQRAPLCLYCIACAPLPLPLTRLDQMYTDVRRHVRYDTTYTIYPLTSYVLASHRRHA